MLQSLAADIPPSDWLSNHASAANYGCSDAYLVLAKALFSVLGASLMRVVSESVFAVIGHHSRIVLIYAEVCRPFPVPLKLDGR